MEFHGGINKDLREANKKIFIGGSFLLVAIAIILVIKVK